MGHVVWFAGRHLFGIIKKSVDLKTMSKKFYAHSTEGKPPEEWHTLDEHLKGTAKLASQFAGEFGCGEWGYAAGVWDGNEIETKGF